MTYHFPAPEHYPTDEEKKLEILKYLSDGCWSADTILKAESNRTMAHEHDHVAFFVESNPFFDYPDAETVNELLTDGGMANPNYDLRYFGLTDLGSDGSRPTILRVVLR